MSACECRWATGVGMNDRTLALEVVSKLPVESGHMTPLLFVHGACHAAWCWDVHFLDYFVQHGYAVYALSLCGHGKSKDNKPLQRTRLSDYVVDVGMVASRLPARPVIIGHSLGGMVVQKYLETRSAPAGVLLASGPPRDLWRLSTTVWGEICREVSGGGVSPQRLLQVMFFSADLPDREIYVSKLGGVSYLATLDMLFGKLKPHLVKTPMLVLGATRDRLIEREDVVATGQAYGVEPVMFDMAHDMMLELGWDSVADCIRAWLCELGI